VSILTNGKGTGPFCAIVNRWGGGGRTGRVVRCGASG
jgi:hypothetical protein